MSKAFLRLLVAFRGAQIRRQWASMYRFSREYIRKHRGEVAFRANDQLRWVNYSSVYKPSTIKEVGGELLKGLVQ